MYTLLLGGAFGNSMQHWDTDEAYIEACANGFVGSTGIRCVGRTGLPALTCTTQSDVISIGSRLRREYGVDVIYHDIPPDNHIIFQGEYTTIDGIDVLEWTTRKTHMRKAFCLERRCTTGISVRLLLKSTFDPCSYSDFMLIQEKYPGIVLEFGVYAINVGVIPGRRVVIWEGRLY